MPLINFDSPVVERNKDIRDESIIQIDVENKSKEEELEREEFLKEMQKREEYLRKREEELNRMDERIREENAKIKLIIKAMIKKDEELKKRGK